MDALCHVYEDHHHYNGVAASEMKTNTGAARLGIEKVGGFAGRGVLLDFPKLKGEAWLEPGYMITAADLDAAEQAQGVTVQGGDIVLVRTGYLDMWFQQSGDEGYASRASVSRPPRGSSIVTSSPSAATTPRWR